MTMSEAVPGVDYRVISVMGGCRLNSRLCAIGLVPNEKFKVVNNCFKGPLTVSVKGSRVAIGRHVADKILIRPVRRTGN